MVTFSVCCVLVCTLLQKGPGVENHSFTVDLIWVAVSGGVGVWDKNKYTKNSLLFNNSTTHSKFIHIYKQHVKAKARNKTITLLFHLVEERERVSRAPSSLTQNKHEHIIPLTRKKVHIY